MARFQAQTNALLSEEIEELRDYLGLHRHQKADLLQELTSLASWVIHQALEGRTILARGEDGVRELIHPAIQRLVKSRRKEEPARLALDDAETLRLAEILDHGFTPPPALLKSLRRLADPERKPPILSWADESAA